jgi:SAM-dependent methyltransferase
MSIAQTRLGARRRSSQTRAAARHCDKHCDLCDGTSFDLIAERDRHGDVLHTGICLRCGLVCHMNVPTEEELERFYAHDYRREYHGETTPSPRRVMRAWKNAQRIYRQLAPHVRPTDAVFEVGAGIGCNVKAFELHGYSASGIEPNLGFQSFAAEQLRVRVERSGLFDPSTRGQFDLVLLIHVIEHFRSPRQALERIHGLLRPGGRLYVECPNLAAPFARPGRMFHFAHVHNFTPGSLGMMAQRCGYEVEHLFSPAHDRNLRMLLRRSESAGPVKIDPENVGRTLAALGKYGALGYHLRWDYFQDRAAKVAGYLGEQLWAGPFVRRLIAKCQRRP